MSTIAPVESIPVFAAATGKSAATAAICAATTSAGNVCVHEIPLLFWAVTAVIALSPCTPNAANVFRSAWMPAPPPESLPAMVSTACMTGDKAKSPRYPVGERASSRAKTSRY